MVQGQDNLDLKKEKEESAWYYVKFLENVVQKGKVESVKEEALKIADLIEQAKGKETEEKVRDIEHAVKYAEIPEMYKKKFGRMIKLLQNRIDRGISENFGSLIKHLRESKGYSLKDLEQATGISSSYINRIEKGERKAPSYRIIEKLAEALNQDIAELLNVANSDEQEDLQAVEEFLLSHSYLIGGKRATKEMRERLVEVIRKINNSSWGDSKHKDAMDIMDSIDRFKQSASK